MLVRKFSRHLHQSLTLAKKSFDPRTSSCIENDVIHNPETYVLVFATVLAFISGFSFFWFPALPLKKMLITLPTISRMCGQSLISLAAFSYCYVKHADLEMQRVNLFGALAWLALVGLSLGRHFGEENEAHELHWYSSIVFGLLFLVVLNIVLFRGDSFVSKTLQFFCFVWLVSGLYLFVATRAGLHLLQLDNSKFLVSLHGETALTISFVACLLIVGDRVSKYYSLYGSLVYFLLFAISGSQHYSGTVLQSITLFFDSFLLAYIAFIFANRKPIDLENFEKDDARTKELEELYEDSMYTRKNKMN